MAVKIGAQREKDLSGKAGVQVAVESGERGGEKADGDHGGGKHGEQFGIAGKQGVVEQMLHQPGLQQGEQGCEQRQREQTGQCKAPRGDESV